MSDKIVLRSEMGFDSGWFSGWSYDKTGFFMTPVLTVEPRGYYNLEKRNSKSKNIKNNSGNFIGIKMSYYPDWFTISNYKGLKIDDQILIIPKWGIRKNLDRNFNFETGIGIGYRHFLVKSARDLNDESDVAIDLHLRIGYTF